MLTVKKCAKLKCVTVSKMPTVDVKLAHRMESNKVHNKCIQFISARLYWQGLHGSELFFSFFIYLLFMKQLYHDL